MYVFVMMVETFGNFLRLQFSSFHKSSILKMSKASGEFCKPFNTLYLEYIK